MDLDVGRHCSVPACNVNDLLPIKCLRCSSHFCREHFGIDRHECVATPDASMLENQKPTEWDNRAVCAFDTCKKPSLASALDASGSKSDLAVNDALCPKCQKAFCATHRYPDEHNCTGPPPSVVEDAESSSTSAQLAAAKALLAKNFPGAGKSKDSKASSSKPSTSSSKPKAPPKDPAKAAKFKAVELIKMRHKASPGDPKDAKIAVAQDRRLHIYVSNESVPDSPSTLLWFRKELVGGRVLDMLNVRFGLTKSPTMMVVPGETEAEIALDKPIGDQLSDGDQLIVRTRD
ncbi:hypothetical protein DL93DRAFT_2229495 [Clavulina sp. PMI_390]|nr:hypothetical protein DL93DRAFT_2229495 [Clavulina sp. PMI_390]